MLGVPFIHAIEHGIRLVHGNDRALGQDLELRVGDDGGDLDDPVGIRIEPGHFQIDPDQVVPIRHAVPPAVCDCGQS